MPRPGRGPSATPPPAAQQGAGAPPPALHVLLLALEPEDRDAAALVAAQAQIARAPAAPSVPPDEAIAIDSPVSASSESRFTSADASACSITRNASQPSAKLANDQPS